MTALLVVNAPGGVTLHTEIVLPASTPAPTVLIRTPYRAASHRREAEGWARRGYAVAVQDVRGRYDSGGAWTPYSHEHLDGAATLDALVASPWSDGRVICYGTSYGAHCALAAASGRPEHTVAVIAAVPALSLRRVARDRNGHPRYFGHSWWWLQHGHGQCSQQVPIANANASEPGALAVLPPLDLAEEVGAPATRWAKGWMVDGEASSLPVLLDSPVGSGPPDRCPLLVIGGLHDVFRDDAMDLASAWPGDVDLLLGAWQHDLGLIERAGSGDLRRRSAHEVKVGRHVAGWLDRVLERATTDADPRTVIALEGSNAWAEPDPERSSADVALHPVQKHFVADPHRPHPSLLGPVDASATLRRRDLAQFRSSPLPDGLSVVGRPIVTLSGLVACSANGRPIDGPVDWAVRLVLHTAPDDRAETDAETIQLVHGMIRSASSEATLELPLTSRRLNPEARVEVQVAGHQFPLYARDPHDGTDPLTATCLRTAHRSVADVRLSLPLGLLTSPPTEPPQEYR